MKLLMVTGTRADYGLWRPVLGEIDRRSRPDVEAGLLVTGMHLDERFGSTVDEVRGSGRTIVAEIPSSPAGDGRAEMAQAIGVSVTAMAPVIESAAPDWLLLLGDRGEQLAAGIVGLHLGVAIAHLHGGERTLGAVDDAIRDMVSRLAHLHFVADPSAAARLERLGEQPWRIHVTGAPGLDDLADVRPEAVDAIRERLHVQGDRYAILVYHPETVGRSDPVADLREVLAAIADAGLPTVAILPNTDAGGRAIRDALLASAPDLRAVVASLPRDEYAALLAGSSLIVGNSSSGIIEAPLLRVPAVNVGGRQEGRLRGDNVLDAIAERRAIGEAISTALSDSFRTRLSGASPYGSGGAASRIVEALLTQPIDDRLLVKEVA